MIWWVESVDSGVVSDLDGVMFAPRDQTVKMAVGAQIGFLHRRSAQESVAEQGRGDSVCYSERRQAWYSEC
jgi:hypothetical protein